MIFPGCLSLLLFTVFFLRFQEVAFLRLGFPRGTVSFLVPLLFAGGVINIPVYHRRLSVPELPPQIGLFNLPPYLIWGRPEQVVALNLGGCILPLVLTAFTASHLSATALPQLVAATVLVASVARLSSRNLPGQGVGMLPLPPALVSALLATQWSPEIAPMVAFCSGTWGVLIGADLVRLPQLLRQQVPVIAIGGAGTYDGILITGLLAGLLAG